jgi:hypothetical protein
MQTHRDSDAENLRNEWFENLKLDADLCRLQGKSNITGGKDDEQVLNEWKRRGVHVRELPRDEHGILRISIGGGSDTPVELNYCVFRGAHHKCVDLLRKALMALQEGPEE